MDCPIDYAAAMSECPAKVAEARAALNASKSKKKGLADKDLTWKVSLGVRIQALDFNQAFFGAAVPKPAWQANVAEAMRETDPQGYCDAKIASGEFLVTLSCEGYASSVFGAADKAPSVLVAQYAVNPQPAWTPSAEPAIFLRGKNIKLPGVHEMLLEGIYEKGTGADKQVIAVAKGSPMLYELDAKDGRALMNGGFAPAASKAFDAAPPGAIFKYRNMPMRRWTDAEINAFFASSPKTWDVGLGSAYGSMAARAPKPSAILASELVYADGADGHPNPKPVGTVGQLGLMPGPMLVAAPAVPAKAAAVKVSKKAKP